MAASIKRRCCRRPLAAVIVWICITTCDAFGNNPAGLYETLNASSKDAWKYIFGQNGQRGEYMDGYSAKAMLQRCTDDYKWGNKFSSEDIPSERAKMMSHLYDNNALWEHVCMVAFAEHYVITDCKDISKPYDTFKRQKHSQPDRLPIFSGVAFSNWHMYDEDGTEQKLKTFKKNGIDYVRLECNLGCSVDDIQAPEQLSNNILFKTRFNQLSSTAKACQEKEMVPLVLLQVPWREGDAINYFEQAVTSFAGSLRNTKVESNGLFFETRPPIGISAQEERGMSASDRVSIGLATGQKMFDIIEEAFGGDTIAGFCVAGGSTKGNVPTAMEDDTQNAVRQGIRQGAQRKWGYDLVFWEMGAKLMLQPKVGRLWDKTSGRRDAARELFSVNAEDLADEIQGLA